MIDLFGSKVFLKTDSGYLQYVGVYNFTLEPLGDPLALTLLGHESLPASAIAIPWVARKGSQSPVCDVLGRV